MPVSELSSALGCCQVISRCTGNKSILALQLVAEQLGLRFSKNSFQSSCCGYPPNDTKENPCEHPEAISDNRGISGFGSAIEVLF